MSITVAQADTIRAAVDTYASAQMASVLAPVFRTPDAEEKRQAANEAYLALVEALDGVTDWSTAKVPTREDG